MPDYLLNMGRQLLRNPQWADIEAAIRQLGISPEINTVLLQAPDEELPWLTVGGTCDDRYYLSVELRPAETFVLVDRDAPDDYVEVSFPFGEWDMMPMSHLIGLDKVLMAAEHYFKFCATHPQLTWEKHGSGLKG